MDFMVNSPDVLVADNFVYARPSLGATNYWVVETVKRMSITERSGQIPLKRKSPAEGRGSQTS
jgi:hypothetical protein